MYKHYKTLIFCLCIALMSGCSTSGSIRVGIKSTHMNVSSDIPGLAEGVTRFVAKLQTKTNSVGCGKKGVAAKVQTNARTTKIGKVRETYNVSTRCN